MYTEFDPEIDVVTSVATCVCSSLMIFLNAQELTF